MIHHGLLQHLPMPTGAAHLDGSNHCLDGGVNSCVLGSEDGCSLCDDGGSGGADEAGLLPLGSCGAERGQVRNGEGEAEGGQLLEKGGFEEDRPT